MASLSFAVVTSMDVPQTQNTAPVLEFQCLYTQDLRRKQKRWQDGRLKFHTFNKRVMVYDERSNFVGDTHWREDAEFDEGEELELERGGILVEVGECVGKRDQDLFELVDKRVKEREERVAKIAASSLSRPRASLLRTTQASPTGVGPLQHKPLNAILAPTGHYGRAVVPHISPFEENHRLIRDSQDGTENRRPTKRQKQNEDAPSKNVYARNLMGATLTLASSKPPSTAAIRYESTITRSGFQETPAATIDLTGDEDGEERNIGSGLLSVRGEQDSGEPRDKGQRRLKRFPPRRGYARSLIGASLTLFRPEDLSSRRSNKTITTGTSANATLQEENDSPETEEGGSNDFEHVATKLLAATRRSEEPPKKILKSPKRDGASNFRSSSSTTDDNASPVTKASKGSTRDKAKPTNEVSAFEERSSSPTMVEVPLPMRKPTRNIQRPPIQNPSAAAHNPEQPFSALRIKARPPRKMMMLMDRPISRSSTNSESSSTGLQKPQLPENSSLASNEVVLSQATMQLNSFCRRQQDIIQARLNGKRTDLNSADPLPSPEDRGIDHQTIDVHLSRKSLTIENKSKPRPNQSNSGGKAHKSAVKSVQLSPANDPSRRDILEFQPRTTSRFVSESAPYRPRDYEDACPKGQNIVPRSNINSDREKLTSNSSFIQSEKSTASAEAAFTSASESSMVSPLLSTEGKEQRNLPKESRTSPMTAKFPEPFRSAIQAATEQFRAMIKSSASSTVQLADVASFPPREEDHIETSLPEEPFPHQNFHTVSCEVVEELSPRSSPIGEVSSIGSELLQAATGSDPATCLDGSLEKAIVPVVTENIRKARLVNPATRGKSLQTIAADTVDSLAPVFSLMPPPPPPPRITILPQRNPDRNMIAEEKTTSSGYVVERTIAGPWSRESFDLFGSWLPPGTGGVAL